MTLDSSKVLFASDASVKLCMFIPPYACSFQVDITSAHFDQCESSGISSARSIGIIAIEMMQNGIAPGPEDKLSLKSPALWTSRALEFLELASNATIGKVRKASNCCQDRHEY